jgi:hypothetical protein
VIIFQQHIYPSQYWTQKLVINWLLQLSSFHVEDGMGVRKLEAIVWNRSVTPKLAFRQGHGLFIVFMLSIKKINFW